MSFNRWIKKMYTHTMEHYSAFKRKGPGWCGSLDWVPACETKGGWLIPSQCTCLAWGPDLQLGAYYLCHIDISFPLFFPSLPFSKNKHKYIKSKKKKEWSWNKQNLTGGQALHLCEERSQTHRGRKQNVDVRGWGRTRGVWLLRVYRVPLTHHEQGLVLL